MSRLLRKIFKATHGESLPSRKSLDSMGVCNTPWGICGFTSSLYALYTNSRTKRQNKLGKGGLSPTQMLAEIKGYLRLLQAEGKQDILDSIEEFTQSFAGFETWTIADYIVRVNAVVAQTATESYLKDGNFGVGMPPDAVVDYLKRICGFSNARVIDLSSDVPEMILGMGTTKTGMPLYDGLGHYLYSLNSEIYSWGMRFGSTQTAMNGLIPGISGKDFTIVAKIAVK